MKTIGLVGGFSWHSSAEYYRQINESVVERLGGHHSAHLVLRSVDFGEIVRLITQGRMSDVERVLVHAALSVEAAGAQFLLLAANTAHRFAEPVAAAISIPLVHIADVTASRVAERGISRVGLIGTRATMEGDHVVGRLRDRHGLAVVVPNAGRRSEIDALIEDSLTVGDVTPAGTRLVETALAELVGAGAQGVVLACTELALTRPSADVPCFDTTALHAESAVELALQPD